LLKSNVQYNCYKYNTNKNLKTYSNWNEASCASGKTMQPEFLGIEINATQYLSLNTVKLPREAPREFKHFDFFCKFPGQNPQSMLMLSGLWAAVTN